MGVPAVVLGDRVMGVCPVHQVPGPLGVPVPSPPLPFSAPLLTGLTTKVLICGKPAAVLGSSGYNLPPHAGLHPADPFAIPVQQMGRVLTGSATVLFEGKPAAKTGSACMMCATPGQVVGSAATVLIGG